MQDRTLRCIACKETKSIHPGLQCLETQGSVLGPKLHAWAVQRGHRAPALADKSPVKKLPAKLSLRQLPHAHQESKVMACISAEKLGPSHRCHHFIPCYKTVHQAGVAPS